MKFKKKLSEQEVTVLKCLKLGKRSRDIAEFMEIDSKTVSTYIKRIRIKAGISVDVNLYMLVIKCKELGYFTPELWK